MTAPTISINFVVTAQGAQPTSPTTLWANLVTLVASINPGYTVLPGGLIEDLASTGTYALALIDSACVELINSVSPYTANAWLLVQLGNIYGVPQGLDTNASVFVVFSSNTPGFQINPGWLVSDGTNQYAVQDGTTIQSDGQSPLTFCVATVAGVFGIPAGAVDQTVTQPPAGQGITITVTNPQSGTPQAAPQTEADYRTQVLAAGLVSGQGNQSMLKTLLGNVAGVQGRLIGVRQQSGGWEVICGGGDPFAVANAIYQSGVDLSTLVGSDNTIAAATQANPCVITTSLFHGFTNGQTGIVISGALGMTVINGTWTVTTTGLPPNQFSIAHDTTSSPAYTGGGTVTPNSGTSRNVSVDLNDWPDTYTVIYVSPPAVTVNVQLEWDTISPNFVSDTAVAQLGAPAIATYINALPVGVPLNLNAMGAAFIASVAALFNNNAEELISSLAWTISLNGVEVSPASGSFLIFGDSEGFFTCAASAVAITQV